MVQLVLRCGEPADLLPNLRVPLGLGPLVDPPGIGGPQLPSAMVATGRIQLRKWPFFRYLSRKVRKHPVQVQKYQTWTWWARLVNHISLLSAEVTTFFRPNHRVRMSICKIEFSKVLGIIVYFYFLVLIYIILYFFIIFSFNYTFFIHFFNANFSKIFSL